MLYILSAGLSGSDAAGETFLARVASRVTIFHPVSLLSNASAMGLANVRPDDGVTFVIGEDPSPQAADFLRSAADSGALVLPIALDAAHRQPPAVVGKAQSFDVADALRRASAPLGQGEWAARMFAREALARLAPTCFRNRLRIFLSYRRQDGEGLTADLDRELSARHEHVFRDLVEIQVGEPAQDVIDQRLRDADVIVFIDTPRAGESPWVAGELATAMGRGIPIVWARIGSLEGRALLAVAPGEAPQVEIGEPTERPVSEVAQAILDASLDQVHEAIRASTSAFAMIRRWANDRGATVTVLDQRRLIYAVTIPYDAAAGLPRRPRQDIVQLFARNPDAEDVSELRAWLREAGYSGHPVACRAFDAAVLVRPTTAALQEIEDWGVVESGDGYLERLVGQPRSPEPSARPILLLLGAFPTEPMAHPAVIAAVSALSRSWLRLGGTLTFGSHPTFTPLIAEAARAVLPPDARDRILAVRSEYFPRSKVASEVGGALTTQSVPASSDLDASLTAMRRALIVAGRADIAVLVGGRTSEGGTHLPGVEEELRLARDEGIPVIALGSPGGQASAIVERERRKDPPWTGLGNGFSDDVNALLADTDDYATTARILWERFGMPTK